MKPKHVIIQMKAVLSERFVCLSYFHMCEFFVPFHFSCSLLVDFDIHVWDIRRPYIPYASFCEHKDVVTGTGR